MLTYRWRTKLKIRPSLRSPEIINGYNFEVLNGETFVTIEYETPSFDSKLPDSRDDYEYADQTIARQHADRICNMMLARMIYMRVPEILRVDIASGPTLLNKDELDAAGVHKLRSVVFTFDFSRAILDVGQTLSESQVFWSAGFTKKSAKHEEDLLRIADWVVSAEAESSHYKRFIMRWIAFNGLYGLYDTINGITHKKDKDKDKIEKMLIGLLANNANEILNLYFQKMVRALIENRREDAFVESIKSILRSNKYTVMQSVSATLTCSRNILGPLPEMMLYSASKFLAENHAWPPKLAAAIIFCINALEISVNIKLISRFNAMGRADKAKLVEDDRSLSLEDKFSWLLTDAFNSSLKGQSILWTWLDNI